jgi:hypothetical protein
MDARAEKPNPAARGAADGSSALTATVPLRIGIFMHAPKQPFWWVWAMRDVQSCGLAQIALLACGAQQRTELPWVWRAYAAADARLSHAGPDPARALDAVASIPHDRRMPLPDAHADPVAIEAWRRALASLQLDVAFATAGVADGLLEGAAKYGVWRYCFGDGRGLIESLAGVREAATAAPVCASGIRVRMDADGSERLVYRSWSRTVPVSVSRTRAHLLRKTSHFASRALQPLHASSAGWLERWDSLPRIPSGGSETVPRNPEALRGVTGIAARVAKRVVQKLACVDQWFLAYRFSSDGDWHADLRDYRCMVPPRDRIWADPFPIERKGRHFVFFEELVFAEHKAHIAVVELGVDGPMGTPRRVLERAHHLSYPCLVEQGGELFMVPESGGARNVVLYRCLEFPHRWREQKVLLEGRWFTDATLHYQDGLWWMFVNVGVDGGEAHDELHLYFAETLLGEWKPHPCNPVRSDVRGARPAGRPYMQDGMLLRPAQICAPLYGSGVAINHVVQLSPHAYEESERQKILPVHSTGVLGIHTLNRAGGLCVIDAFMRRKRVGGLGRSLSFPLLQDAPPPPAAFTRSTQ